MKFLFGVFILNVALFSLAKGFDIALWKIIGAEIAAFFVWIAIKTWFSVAQQLVNQASHMGWVADGTVKDDSGYRDTLLRRGSVLAKVSYAQKCVFLVEPYVSGPYKDFVAVEQYLAKQ